MARRIVTEMLIDAPPETVWSVLTDFPSHPDWDPFFASLDGDVREGETLTVAFRQGMTMRPRVTESSPAHALEWLGKLAFGGLFDGRHRFELDEMQGRTRLVHSETFTGLLVPFVGKLLADTERSFRAFNEALKRQAEQAQA